MGRRSSFLWTGVALLCTANAAALEATGLTLETGSPDALCPELEATREIVARRLGSLVFEGRKGWVARYTIGHAPAGNPRDFVRLELFNPDGGVELRRDLPIEGDSCRTMSEVIALVLDRHFRGLVAADAADSVDVAETKPPSAAGSTPREASHGPLSLAPRRLASPQPASAPALPLLGKGPRLSAEYAATLAQPEFGLHGSAALGSKLEAGLNLRWVAAASEESEPRGAHVEVRSVSARATLAWKYAFPPGLLRLGPALSVALEWATTSGLPSRTDRVRALWRAGLEAGFVVPVARHWFVEGTTSLEFLLPGTAAQFLVDNREVLTPRAFSLGGALGFGYVWGE